MAEKRAKKPKDLDPKGKGAQVKGGKNLLSGEQRRFTRKVLRRGTGTADAAIRPKD